MNLSKRQDSTIAIQQISQKYTKVLGSNFQKKQQELINQLFQEAKVLKNQIALYKKQTSSENIERLICDRRRQKQKERQNLEAQWRQCTQSFKKLQQQQKRLVNQHKENQFDLQNLQSKISEFEQHLKVMKNSPKKKFQDSTNFVTEVKQNYRSPYKACDSVQEKTLVRLEQQHKLLFKTQQHFFTKKYNLNTTSPLRPLSKFSKSQPTPQINNQRLIKTFKSEVNQRSMNDQIDLPQLINLKKFLGNRDVKLKIFKFLKKQL